MNLCKVTSIDVSSHVSQDKKYRSKYRMEKQETINITLIIFICRASNLIAVQNNVLSSVSVWKKNDTAALTAAQYIKMWCCTLMIKYFLKELIAKISRRNDDKLLMLMQTSNMSSQLKPKNLPKRNKQSIN